VADVNGYAASYLVSAGIQAVGVPFAILARRERAASDPIIDDEEPTSEGSGRRPAAPVG
jgi:hypothetical protein